MVGVPGRSKACPNCRKRRIKCDGARPGCQNCSKSGRICAGYQRKHAFVLTKDVTIDNRDASWLHEADSGLVCISSWNGNRNKPFPSKVASRTLGPRRSMAETPITQQPSSCYLHRCHLFGRYISYHSILLEQTRKKADRHWLLEISNLARWTPALEYAALAASMARIGLSDNNPLLVRESLSFYTQGLRELRKAVFAPTSDEEDQTFAAVLLLLQYEVYECPGKTAEGYMSHCNGYMQLLKIRGPSAYRSSLACSVFRAFRLHIVFQGFSQRSRTFLADRDWCAIPWTHKKESFDELIDVLLDAPKLLAQSDAIGTLMNPYQVFAATLETISDAQRLDNRLSEWYKTFAANLAGELYHAKLSTRESCADDPNLGKVFPVEFHFPAFSIASNMVYYWMGQVAIHSHLCFQYQQLAGLMEALASTRELAPCTCGNYTTIRSSELSGCVRHFDMSFLPPLGLKGEWPRTAAYNMCQSMVYCLQHSNKVYGPATAISALMLLKEYWMCAPGQWTREITWVDDFIQTTVGRNYGLSIYSSM